MLKKPNPYIHTTPLNEQKKVFVCLPVLFASISAPKHQTWLYKAPVHHAAAMLLEIEINHN